MRPPHAREDTAAFGVVNAGVDFWDGGEWSEFDESILGVAGAGRVQVAAWNCPDFMFPLLLPRVLSVDLGVVLGVGAPEEVISASLLLFLLLFSQLQPHWRLP